MASDRSLGAMCGYLAVRRRSARATTHRVFAVISGTTLFEFDSFEDAAIGVRAREHACVIGVCAWDGCSRPRCGFVYVTRGGGPVFATAKSEDEQQQWASAIQRALEHALEGDGDPDVPPSSSDSRCLTTLTDGLEIKSSALQDGPAAFEQLLSLLQFTRGVMTEWLLRSGGPAPMPGPPSSSAPSPPPPPDGPGCEDAAAAPEDLAAVRASLSADADVIVVVRLLYDLALDGTPQSFQLVVEELATRGLDAMDFVWFQVRFRPLRGLSGHTLPGRITMRAPSPHTCPNTQVVHIFYFLSAERFSTRVLKTELLKRLIVNVCATSAHLSLKLAWALFAYLEDIQRLDVAAEHRLAREIPVIALLAELQLCVLAEAGADTAPVCRELARVRDCRELVRTSLARPTDKTERTAAAHRADVPPAAADDVRMCSHEQRQAVREQLRFVAHLGQIAERMRFTEPRQRRDALVTELSELGCLMSPPEPKSIGCRTGFDPFGRAEQTLEPIVNIPVNEGHVFHTKARAPTMIVCEVLRTSSVDGSSDETPSESCSALCDDDDGVKELIAKHCVTGLQDYLFSAAFAQTAVDSAAQRALEAETRTDPRLVRSHSDNRLTSTGAGKLTRGSKVNAPAPGLRGDIPELKEDIASKDETMAAVVNSHRRETMSPAVASAVELHEKGVISAAEFAECIRKDALFQDAVDEHQHFDVEFCISHAFGESWASKRSRIRHESPVPAAAVEPSTSQNASARWDLVSMIVKSNDDVRQEVCVLQLIQLCGTIFCGAGLELWLRPYSIISTSASTGLIEVHLRRIRRAARTRGLRPRTHARACSSERTACVGPHRCRLARCAEEAEWSVPHPRAALLACVRRRDRASSRGETCVRVVTRGILGGLLHAADQRPTQWEYSA